MLRSKCGWEQREFGDLRSWLKWDFSHSSTAFLPYPSPPKHTHTGRAEVDTVMTSFKQLVHSFNVTADDVTASNRRAPLCLLCHAINSSQTTLHHVLMPFAHFIFVSLRSPFGRKQNSLLLNPRQTTMFTAHFTPLIKARLFLCSWLHQWVRSASVFYTHLRPWPA